VALRPRSSRGRTLLDLTRLLGAAIGGEELRRRFLRGGSRLMKLDQSPTLRWLHAKGASTSRSLGTRMLSG
jgi:hypothetical protein